MIYKLTETFERSQGVLCLYEHKKLAYCSAAFECMEKANILSMPRLTFEEVLQKRKDLEDDKMPAKDVEKAIVVEPHTIPNRGPYLFNQPKK